MCGRRSRLATVHLLLCVWCIHQDLERARPPAEKARARVRNEFEMVVHAPRTGEGSAVRSAPTRGEW